MVFQQLVTRSVFLPARPLLNLSCERTMASISLLTEEFAAGAVVVEGHCIMEDTSIVRVQYKHFAIVFQWSDLGEGFGGSEPPSGSSGNID